MPPADEHDDTSVEQALAALLGEIPPPLSRRITSDTRALRCSAGTVLFEEGSACGGMLVLESGCVRVSRLAADGRELLLYRVRPGESCVLTTSCLLERSAYPARGLAETDVRGVLVPADLFDRLLQEAPAFRRFVFGSFVQRIAGLLDLAAAVSFERLDQRLASALLAQVESSGRIEWRVTHQELAQEVGSVRERVSRLLEGFESRGLVELGRGRLRVLDKPGLGRVARGES